MKQHATKAISLWISVLFLSLFVACEKKDSETAPIGINAKVNKFSVGAMKHFYVWNKEISSSIKDNSEDEPIEHFLKMRYKDDGWSRLENTSSPSTRAEIDETTTDFGWWIYPFSFIGESKMYIAIEYVNPNSPAANAGLKRGDIIYKVNGNFLTTEKKSLTDFLALKSMSIEVGEMYVESNTIDVRSTGKNPLNLQVTTKCFDSVLHAEIINEDEPDKPQIGYLCYSSFTKASRTKLKNTFAYFKQKGITEMILDLRFNLGGYADVANALAGMIAPKTVLDNKTIYLKRAWNAEMMKLQKEDEIFDSSVINENLNLERIYILTTEITASASEATILALRPYMEVVHIGERTLGKFCGGLTITPEDYFKEFKLGKDSDIEGVENWEATIMVYKFSNINGESAQGGIAPTYEKEKVDSAIDLFFKPLGSPEDPMTQIAVSLIETGKLPVRKSTRSILLPEIKDYKISSKNKSEMIICKESLYK
ncbi:S41 family peptidase [Bacteroides sp. 224]|uniref:S41 family peptidase n=1 Tax=Bacteroides sp. 224 TaxID=2302936 RepID=UPI0013D6BB0F|nr:S41 family peptidase [Bacteroides sp. 224]NDV66298.1 PDZ domain-containing protein [Bacteroides sp. 224]